jgi:hypothetical protein
MGNFFNLNALGRKEFFLWRRQNGSLNPVLSWSNFPQKGHYVIPLNKFLNI